MERYDDYYRSTPEVFGSDPNSILVEYAGLETARSIGTETDHPNATVSPKPSFGVTDGRKKGRDISRPYEGRRQS
jgi:hypothetical protein